MALRVSLPIEPSGQYVAAPKTTIWELEPHTRAKHEILKRYLQAWMPILSQGGFPDILYIDGFAGPGRYAGGEDGSPLIALRAATAREPRLTANFRFIFVELDEARGRNLEQLVAEFPLPQNLKAQTEVGRTFESVFDEQYRIHAHRDAFPPTFAFIDPFGWNGMPFEIIKRIMSHQNCEVFINFMFEEINRFLGHPDQPENFDRLFGTARWRDGIGLADPRARNRFLHDLYLSQILTNADVKYVRSFEMKNKTGLTDYYLYYATNSLLGLKKMKEAMWKVDEGGEFLFSDATNPNQLTLFAKIPDYSELRGQILARFQGRTVTVDEVETFVVAETAFRETHFKRQILKALEAATPPLVEVVGAAPSRRRGTFPDPNMRLRF